MEKFETEDFKKLKNLGRKFVISLIFGVLVISCLIFIGEYNKILNALSKFPMLLIPIVCLLTTLNFGIRYLKWLYYTKQMNIQINHFKNILIYIIGYSMTITPGKVGEILKSYLLKKECNVEISKTAPIVLGEKITDLFAVIILCLTGIMYFNNYIGILILSSMIGFFIILLVRNHTFFNLLMRFTHRFKILSKFSNVLENLYKTSYSILNIKGILIPTLISIPAWFFEALGFYVVIYGLGYNPHLFLLISIYLTSLLAGVAVMLPGGLGLTEGGLSFLLVEFVKMSLPEAIAATLIIRFCTLWFSVFLGFLSFIVYKYIVKGKL